MIYQETFPLLAWYPVGLSTEACWYCAKPPSPCYGFGEFSPYTRVPISSNAVPRCSFCVPKDIEGRLVKEGGYQDLPVIPPIFVLGTSRGGSSLLWKLLVAAGVWMGEWIEDLWAMDIASKGCSEAGMGDHQVPMALPDRAILSRYLSQRLPSLLDTRRASYPWGFNYPTLFWGTEDILRLAPDAKILIIFREVEGWVEAWKRVSTLPEERFRLSHELILQELERWREHPKVLLLSLDEGHRDPARVVRRIANFTGLPLTPQSEVWFAPRPKI